MTIQCYLVIVLEITNDTCPGNSRNEDAWFNSVNFEQAVNCCKPGTYGEAWLDGVGSCTKCDANKYTIYNNYHNMRFAYNYYGGLTSW